MLVPDERGRAVPVVCMRPGSRLDSARWSAATRDLPVVGEPFEVDEAALQRTATVKARRYAQLIHATRNGAAAP